MLRNQSIRRPLALLLVVLGAILIFLATNAWAGAALVVLGISIELIGIAIRHK